MSATDDVAELAAQMAEIEAEGTEILRTIRDPQKRAKALAPLLARHRRARKALQHAYFRLATGRTPERSREAEEAVSAILEELGLAAFRVGFALLFYLHSIKERSRNTELHALWISVPGLPDGLVYAPDEWDWSAPAVRP